MQTKFIKEKIKSIGSIKKITKTMEMVSAAKMKKAVENARIIRPFHEEAQHILSDISLDAPARHELLTPNGAIDEVKLMQSTLMFRRS